MVCGKEMTNTLGGNYHCENCGHGVNDLVNRPSNCDIPMPQGFGKQEGWICPVCGRGVAPHMNWCPCQGSGMKITYGTSTGGMNTELNKLFELNDARVSEIVEFNKTYGD
jgi:hypothetical protein